ncbi:hypothetical protein D3C71_1725370 [compost metagenome]
MSSTPISSAAPITTTVIHGTPCLDSLLKARGAWPCWARPYIMRPAPKMSLLIAEIAAEITTTLSTAAAEPIPRLLKICTNGLPSLPICGHGYRHISTNRVST